MLVRTVFIVLIVLALTGCEEIARFNDPPKHLIVKVENTNNIETTKRVLLKRFYEYPVSLFSSIGSKAKDNRITFTFNRGAPKKEIVDYLAGHKGELIVRTEKGDMWFSSQDIINASSSFRENRNYLSLTLSDVAGQRVSSISKRDIGKIVTVHFDSELFSEVKIMASLGKRLQIDVEKNIDELNLIAAIIHSGALPEKVTILKNEL